jgi:hypothetical protein
LRYPSKMTSEKEINQILEKSLHTLDEICEHTRAIRRVVNRILDHLHEFDEVDEPESDTDYDPDNVSWEDLDNNDDMFM